LWSWTHHPFAWPAAAILIGAVITMLRLPLQPILHGAQPLLFAWPGIMLAAFIGGFWPAVTVTALGVVVGEYVVIDAGLRALGPVAIAIFVAFGLVFAAAGGMRKRGLRLAREDAARLEAMREQMTRVARLNAMGEMAGNLAHELNQPLTAIASYLGASRRLLERTEAPAANVLELLDKATAQALRARDIVGRIRNQLRGEGVALAPQSLAEIVDETLAVVTANGQLAGAAIRRDLDSRSDEVLVDRAQVQQVFLNLVRNGLEAMAGAPRPELRIASQRQAGGLVQVTVADNGPGVAPEVAGRLFEPFATGKADGMGIGLSISRHIIEAHGGELWLDASARGGAVFRFTLQSADTAAAPS
jgi:C4-dicarboxylate-specific signal transduction histidine kinase